MLFLGIDYGTRRTGVALADTRDGVVVDYAVLETDSMEKLLARLDSLVKKEKICKMVVGLPLGKDGQETPRTEKIRRFGAQLAELTRLPVEYEDERFTSCLFERLHIQKEIGKELDALSAAAILESYLKRNGLCQR